jgi:hypothetical protein
MNLALRDHPGANSAPAGMKYLGDPRKFPVNKWSADCLARRRERRDFEDDFGPDPKADSWHDQIPIEPFNGQVFSSSADVDWVPLSLKGANALERIEDYGAIGASMVLFVIVGVILKPVSRHYGVSNTSFGYTTAWNIYREDSTSSIAI